MQVETRCTCSNDQKIVTKVGRAARCGISVWRFQRRETHDCNSRKGKNSSSDDTHQEAAYLKMLGEKQTPVRIKLMGGEWCAAGSSTTTAAWFA